ncbi:hypothetical protein [Ferruginibacter sp.]
MPTQRVYAALALCAAILFSCNERKTVPDTASTVSPEKNSAAMAPAVDALRILSYNDQFIANCAQHFVVAASRVSVVTAKGGLKVTVNPASLQYEDGSPVNSEIAISIVELTNSADLFRSNAATMSNGRLLASGGSYFIGMESGSKKIQIKKGAHLQVDFPKLKDSDMELFYGKRDDEGNMNWLPMEQPLSFSQHVDLRIYEPPYPDSVFNKTYKNNKYQLYNSIESKVIFDNKTMSLKEMVATLQSRGIDKIIDTMTIDLTKTVGYKRSPFYFREHDRWYKMYRMISSTELAKEKDSVCEEEKRLAIYREANQKYTEEWNRVTEENSLTGQVQRYYAPSSINRLGWINCDRFYDNPQKTEVPLELPITLDKPDIQYFIIYKSFNGLMNGSLGKSSGMRYILQGLPVGQEVTFVAFTKSNGQIMQCKEDFVIGKQQSIKPEFKNISEDEMKAMFGKNVRI